MGFSLEVSVPMITVFLQGLLSFFSPCVLPILPLYISYLSGGTGVKDEDGRIHYKRSKVMVHTVCFVAGVSFAFFVLALGADALGSFFRSGQLMFARLGGVVVILFGLYQLGLFGDSAILGKERRLPFRLDQVAMSPWTALVMGFTFSFAWTPCVGPALASVLLMAASASTRTAGFFLIGVYTLGFVLPFLAAGLFTTSLLELFKKHMGVVKYTVKLGGVLLVVLGLLIFTGKMNGLTSYLSQLPSPVTEMSGENQSPGAGDGAAGARSDDGSGTGGAAGAKSDNGSGEADGTNPDGTAGKTGGNSDSGNRVDGGKGSGENGADGGSGKGSGENQRESGKKDGSDGQEAGKDEEKKIAAPDFELEDQYGQVHKLSDYKGKTVFLNFWATWCPPCRAEMPDIQKLYEEYDTEGDEALIILGVAGPGMGNEGTKEEIAAFLEENGYTYPVVMDSVGQSFTDYGIYAYPTTFMIDKEGNVFGYASGQLSYDMMKDIIRQTMEGKRRK